MNDRDLLLKLQELKLQRLKRFKKQQQTAKLPKLTITPFKNSCLQWFWFLEQFDAEVDKTKIAATSEFSY